MTDILKYASYTPFHRLSRSSIGQAWNKKASPGEKAAVYFDEDALTLAAAAAWRCHSAHPQTTPDALYFASTSSPFSQRSAAAQIAACCDLPASCATADFGGSLRSATSALHAGMDGIEAGRLRSVLVASGEVRSAPPGSEEEQNFGDAGAALLLGAGGGLAKLHGRLSLSSDFLDEWRMEGQPWVQSYTSKFSLDHGYLAQMSEAVEQLCRKVGVKLQEFDRLILTSSDARANLLLAKKLGCPPEMVQNTLYDTVGPAGCVMPLLLLTAALETARAGEKMLLAAYGDGVDVFFLETTEQVAQSRPAPGLAQQLARKTTYSSYSIYRALREFRSLPEDSAPPLSNVLLTKQEPENVRLHGTRCRNCGLVQYPPTRVCQSCREKENLATAPLSRQGTVFTFTKDFLHPSPHPPTVMTVVDLDDGGRLYLQMTDVEPDQVRVGDRVEVVWRRMRDSGGLRQYWWKCRPLG